MEEGTTEIKAPKVPKIDKIINYASNSFGDWKNKEQDWDDIIETLPCLLYTSDAADE